MNMKDIARSQMDPDALIEHGDSLFSAKKYGEAIKVYDQIIAIASDYYEAWQHKAEALKASGRLREALACYEDAYAIYPSIVAQSMISNLRRQLEDDS